MCIARGKDERVKINMSETDMLSYNLIIDKNAFIIQKRKFEMIFFKYRPIYFQKLTSFVLLHGFMTPSLRAGFHFRFKSQRTFLLGECRSRDVFPSNDKLLEMQLCKMAILIFSDRRFDSSQEMAVTSAIERNYIDLLSSINIYYRSFGDVTAIH